MPMWARSGRDGSWEGDARSRLEELGERRFPGPRRRRGRRAGMSGAVIRARLPVRARGHRELKNSRHLHRTCNYNQFQIIDV